MTKKRTADKVQDFAFDDDTSDSDEEGLGDFQAKVGLLKQDTRSKRSLPLETGACDSESDVGEEDSDSSSEESEEEVVTKSDFKLSEEQKLKLSKLKSQLADIGGDSTSGSESDDDDDDDQNVPIAANKEGSPDKEKEAQEGGESSEEDSDELGDEDEEDSEDDDQENDKPENNTQVSEEKTEENSQSSPAKKMKLDPDTSTTTEESKEEKARKKYRDQLSKMSIEDIQKLKERLGLKLFQQKLEGTAPERGKKVEFKRDNKNRPREMSSKKTVGRFREVVQVAKKERRDPRFDPLCGEFNDKLFKESYQFVNEVKSKELVELKKQLRTEEDHERREEVKYLIQRMENQLRAEAQNQVKRAQAEAENSEKKEKLKSGEKPFYMSKAKRKEAELVSKYEELQSKGGLDSFMRKTTKKKDSKERKKGLGVTVK